MISVSGIYVILHKKSGKVYLGQAQDVKDRFRQHRYELNRNNHHNRHLQFAWNKDGSKAFKFQVLERCSLEQLNQREEHFLKLYMAKGLCYNFADNPTAPMRGRKHSEESKRKIGMAGKGKPAHNKGKHHSEETRAKMREAHKSRPPVSEETRLKIGAKHKGKTISEEHKNQLREAVKHRPPRTNTDETKQKMSEAAKRRWQKQRDACEDDLNGQ
jgi:group I intron endonuclease